MATDSEMYYTVELKVDNIPPEIDINYWGTSGLLRVKVMSKESSKAAEKQLGDFIQSLWTEFTK